MKEDKQLEIVLNLVSSYTGKEPLIQFLKNFFRKNPQMGGRDRRNYTSAVFDFFRLGKSMSNYSAGERLAAGCYLCETETSSLFSYLVSKNSSLDPGEMNLSLDEKIKKVQVAFKEFSTENILPFQHLFSDNFKGTSFSKSVLLKPDIWIRVKPVYLTVVIDELVSTQIGFTQDDQLPGAIRLKAGAKLEPLHSFQKGYFEIQDWSSQKVSSLFNSGENEQWWDACAGSGGKGLALLSRFPATRLLCTDVRTSILTNLETRFRRSGIKNYKTKELDVASDFVLHTNTHFDGIIADVPCTGSGTWARSPERISFFNESSLDQFSELQKQIVGRLVPYLKAGKIIHYITCSVFKKENEDVVNYVSKEFGLKVISQDWVDGTKMGADSMFTALLEKNNVAV